MRFIEHGPNIPDELLLALDEERVVFFCGAGVSRAYADLPDFLGLAKTVLEKLRVLNDDPAYKLLNLAKGSKKNDMSELVSADLIFGELEKDFETHDIEAAVAQALKSKRNVCLKAHKIMLDLATTKTGQIRLVTTNFDRLFERCGTKLKAFQPPDIPDLTKDNTFQGLVYLHGAANKKYNNSDSRFILSSAEFGRAYLAEGWANQFFKQIISKYTVVFVGYGAEDPPVRYLLEALNKKNDATDNIYAFHSGTQKEAEKRWAHKGVTAISCNTHDALWTTLADWVDRTKNTTAWQDDIIKMANRGPETLSPFQCEKVLQLVATKEGAKRFGADDNPPPATWLCLFDSTLRDAVLESPDAFKSNLRDEYDSTKEPLAWLNVKQGESVKKLSRRLDALGEWIAKVSDQNAAVWWAVRQKGIHPLVQDKIKEALGKKSNVPPHIKQAWQYIFDSWNLKFDDSDAKKTDWFYFEEDLARFRWNNTLVRRYEELTKPRMIACPNRLEYESAPQKNVKTDFKKLVDLKIWYDDPRRQIEISPRHLAEIVSVWKRNLDTAIRLEKEKNYYLYPSAQSQARTGYYLSSFPIIASDNPSVSDYQRTRGLPGAVLYYAFLFERLLKHNSQLARTEFQTWNKEEDNVYNRLYIWSGRFIKIVANNDIGSFFTAVSEKVFWDHDCQRDLLHTIKKRWSGMTENTQLAIEKRILQGYKRHKGQAQNEYIKYRDLRILERLDWLKNKRCIMSATTKKEMIKLKKANPEHKDKDIKDADMSLEPRSGMVRTDTDHAVLLELPLSRILDKAQEEINRRDNSFVEYDPFWGLCKKRPIRAFATLRYEAKCGKFRTWAWEKFLYEQTRKKDSIRMKEFIVEVLVRLPDKAATEMIDHLIWWLLAESEQLTATYATVLKKLTGRLINILHKNLADKNSFITKKSISTIQGNDVLNSSLGLIAESLFCDPRIKELKSGQCFPRDWLDLVEDMLNLPDDLGCLALVMFTNRLDWFHAANPQWTHDNLLRPLSEDNPDIADAWWAGYLWMEKPLSNLKLFKKIKPYLLARVSNEDIQKQTDGHIMEHFVLLNWGAKGEQRISDEEFRRILLYAGDGFRSQIIQWVEVFCKQGNNQSYWKDKRNYLLGNVWPLHKHAKTTDTIIGLISLAFADESEFLQLSKAIIPFLDEIKQDYGYSLLYGADKYGIVDKHPARVFEILFAVLPQNVNQWPYDIKKIMAHIGTANPALQRDKRFIELELRMSSR